MKKGMVQEELVRVILIVIVFAIFAAFLTVLLVKLASVSDIEQCRTSVIAKYITKRMSVIGKESPIELACTTRNVDIKPDGVYVNGKKERKFIEGSNMDYNVFKALADEMASCWYMLGEGKVNFFGDFNNNLRCVICSDIEFEGGIGKKMTYEGARDMDFMLGFNYFLQYAPMKKGNTERTYIGYLSDGRIGKDEDVLEETPIDLQGQYAVIFETSKSDKLKESLTFGFFGGAQPAPTFGRTSAIESYYASRLGAKAGAAKFYSSVPSAQLRLPLEGVSVQETIKVETRLSRFLSSYGDKGFLRTIPGVAKVGIKAIPIAGWAASIGMFGYDMASEEQPTLMAVELVPIEQVSAICTQLG